MLSARISNETRRFIYAREGYRCALCDSTKYLQAHGINLNDWDATQQDVEQAVTEYLADYYAPDWNPWGKRGP